jgi:hypothetical protein
MSELLIRRRRELQAEDRSFKGCGEVSRPHNP